MHSIAKPLFGERLGETSDCLLKVRGTRVYLFKRHLIDHISLVRAGQMAKPDVTGAGKQNPPEGGTECGSAVCYRALHRPANQCPNILGRWLETL